MVILSFGHWASLQVLVETDLSRSLLLFGASGASRLFVRLMAWVVLVDLVQLVKVWTNVSFVAFT